MKRKVARLAITGTLAAALAIAIPLTVSKAVVGSVGVPAAIDPKPIAPARGYWPLDAIANAVAAQCRGPQYADSYSGLFIDAPQGQVVVYVTSLARGQQMLRGAAAAHPSIDLARVHLLLARYSIKRLDQAISHLVTAPDLAGAGIRLVGAHPSVDHNGIQAGILVLSGTPVDLKDVSARLTVAAGGIPVTAAITEPGQPG